MGRGRGRGPDPAAPGQPVWLTATRSPISAWSFTVSGGLAQLQDGLGIRQFDEGQASKRYLNKVGAERDHNGRQHEAHL